MASFHDSHILLLQPQDGLLMLDILTMTNSQLRNDSLLLPASVALLNETRLTLEVVRGRYWSCQDSSAIHHDIGGGMLSLPRFMSPNIQNLEGEFSQQNDCMNVKSWYCTYVVGEQHQQQGESSVVVRRAFSVA